MKKHLVVRSIKVGFTIILFSQGTLAYSEDAKKFPLETLVEGVHVSGFVDSSYQYNFNSPDSGENTARVFDRDSNNFTLHAAEIALQKNAAADSPVGFRVDLYAGEDAKLIHSAGLGEAGDAFDLQQAYGELNVPLSKSSSGLNDLLVKAGKYVTLAGAEVIESKDNWNMSRSFLFGYAVPFAHTGVRATYALDNTWDFTLGVNNGWDVADDNNDAKTLETHFGLNNIALPGDSSLTIATQGYFGPEAADNDSNWRNLADVVATYKTPWKPLTLMYNFDYASEEEALDGGRNANWYGHAVYAKYQINDTFALVGRGEYFNDDDGVRVVSGTGASYQGWTGTIEYRPWDNIITRWEARWDHADEKVFDDDSEGSKTDNQTTLGAELIYFFD